jgi:EAL domain-containing protein (putative c-di-GMP-specific phosphodiesterase class I)
MGSALGLEVIAEGIETDEQRLLLQSLGCPKGQGYLFARPQPAAAADALVAGLRGERVLSGGPRRR